MSIGWSLQNTLNTEVTFGDKMFQQGISSVIHLFLNMIPIFLHDLVKQGMSYILPYVLSKDRDKLNCQQRRI